MGLFKKKEKRNESRESLLLEALISGAGVNRETAMSIPVISGYVDLICNTFEEAVESEVPADQIYGSTTPPTEKV